MNVFRYALLAEGNSDDALIPILTWLLKRNGVVFDIVSDRVNEALLRPYPNRCRLSKMGWRIQESLEEYAPALLFVHRDADAPKPDSRLEEIKNGCAEAVNEAGISCVCVVPVQELEAWLMADPKAICALCDRPAMLTKVKFPKLRELERLARPKERLEELLAKVDGRNAKERTQAGITAPRIVEYMDDFSLLLKMPAFAALDKEIAAIIKANGWSSAAP